MSILLPAKKEELPIGLEQFEWEMEKNDTKGAKPEEGAWFRDLRRDCLGSLGS